MELSLTKQQHEALYAIFAWLAAGDSTVFRLGGYAGTGKSTLVAIIRLILKKKRPKWQVAFASFTGKATRVLGAKLKENQAQFAKDNVSTLHSLLYSPIMDNSGQVTGWKRKDKLPFDLLIIDEASMVTAEIWSDVERLGIPVLAVGDHGQLPPVNSAFSLLEELDFALTQIHRQAADSPILQIAEIARKHGEIPVQKFGPGVVKYSSQTSEAGVMLEEFLQGWKSTTLLLAGFNQTRVRLNASVRQAQWRNPQHPEVGDVVVCLKNDWEKGLYNGLTGTISGLSGLPLDDATELPSTYQAEISDESGVVVYQGPIAAQQFGQTESLKFTKKQQREVGQLFDYGYCLTVHKAQGSQAPRVILIEERSQHMSDEDWRRWLYTGVTRAEKELIIFGT